MSTAWPEVALGEVALKLQDGPFGSNLKSSHYLDDGVRVIRLQNIGVGQFDDTDRAFVSTEHFERLSKHRCVAGDILIATLGDPILRACRQPASLPVALNKADCLQLRCDPNLALPEYIVTALNSPVIQNRAELLAHGQTRPRINLTQLRSLVIPLPPIEEQRRIAAVLDQADELRAKRQTSLAVLDSLNESIFLDMFGDPIRNQHGWPQVPLGDLLQRIDSGSSPVCLNRPAQPDEWGVLKLGAVTWGVFDESKNKALPETVQPDPRHEVEVDDLLFTRKNTRELVGACAHVHETRSRLLLSDLVFRLVLRTDGSVQPVFLHRLLSLRSKRREVQRLAGGSAGSMPNISKSKLLGIAIEMPPVELQKQFVRRVTAARASQQLAQAHRSDLDALFASLQHRAFAGQL